MYTKHMHERETLYTLQIGSILKAKYIVWNLEYIFL